MTSTTIRVMLRLLLSSVALRSNHLPSVSSAAALGQNYAGPQSSPTVALELNPRQSAALVAEDDAPPVLPPSLPRFVKHVPSSPSPLVATATPSSPSPELQQKQKQQQQQQIQEQQQDHHHQQQHHHKQQQPSPDFSGYNASLVFPALQGGNSWSDSSVYNRVLWTQTVLEPFIVLLGECSIALTSVITISS